MRGSGLWFKGKIFVLNIELEIWDMQIKTMSYRYIGLELMREERLEKHNLGVSCMY